MDTGRRLRAVGTCLALLAGCDGGEGRLESAASAAQQGPRVVDPRRDDEFSWAWRPGDGVLRDIRDWPGGVVPGCVEVPSRMEGRDAGPDDAGSPPDAALPDGGPPDAAPPDAEAPLPDQGPRPPPPELVRVVLREGAAGFDGVEDTYLSGVEHTAVPETVGNFGAAPQLVVFDAGVRVALLRFDLAGIPHDARIESATLQLHVESIEYPLDPTLFVHRVVGDWAEGTCLNQYECDADGATWETRGPGLGDWDVPGGDYDDLLATVPVADAGRVDVDLTAQVRRWVAGTQANHGVLLRAGRVFANSFVITASEADDAANRPALVVRFRPRPDVGAGSGPLAPRVENETCHFPPLERDLVALQPAWPALPLDRPLWFGGPPGDLRFAAEYDGTIWSFSADPRARDAEEFLQVDVTNATPEEGLLGLAFHPDYARNGRFFVAYSMAGPRRIRLSEYRRDPGDPRRASPDSERVLLEIPKQMEMHNAGDLHFGRDGYLYMATGDGGDDGDPFDNARRPSRLLGKILRLDVDGAAPYAIPADNPFADRRRVAGDDAPARPEVWAYGFRNPWRMGFDRETGDLWLGDVGEDTWESVEFVQRGQFYGWDDREGFVCQDALGADCPGEETGMRMPVHVYGRDQGRCVIGGRVYRGRALPELRGQYVFGDCNSGRVFALALDRSGAVPRVTGMRTLGRVDFGITSFGEDPDGELYVTTFAFGHALYKLAPRADDGAPVPPFPQRLSQTGCFRDTAAHAVAPGVVPFDVNMPLWSDGTDKLRFFALPPDGFIEYDADGAFDLPSGSVLIKTFLAPGAQRRLETRFFVRHDERWEGFTYKWNAQQTDADLLPGALDEALPGGLVWHYPSRAECDACHTAAAGHVLGPRSRQLNGDFDYGRRTMNQLEALERAGYLLLPSAPEELPAWPRLDDAGASLQDRARAWIDSNCSQCHRPGTPQPMDLRGHVPFASAGLCDALPRHGELGLVDARLIAPGDPARSILFHRLSRRGPNQMPPLGTRILEDAAVDVVRDWIRGLQCP